MLGAASAIHIETRAGVGTMIDPSVAALIAKASGSAGGDDLAEFPTG